MAEFKYEFKEDVILEDLKKYIDSTYSKHYAQGKLQATEIIFDADHGVGFCIGNIMKYAQRYGKKNGFDDNDLYKIVHYAIIVLGQKQKEEDEFREYQYQLQLDSD
tara:strand:- start:2241 stop:2558 length:318 start_codon:yes stop_codon:yes gene_type:complete